MTMFPPCPSEGSTGPAATVTRGLLLLLFGLLGGTAWSAPSGSWTGTWQSQWRGGGAVLHLQQTGAEVTGHYPLYEGQVQGTVKGREFSGTWREASGRQGGFIFTLSPDGDSFMGRFDSDEWWTGTRLSDSHAFESPPPDLSSPREALRSFIVAANAARGGFIERIRPALDTIDFAGSGMQSSESRDGALLPQEKIDYARSLFLVLDELTFRIWDLPGSSDSSVPDADRVTVSLEQAGSDLALELSFVKRGNDWLIDPPAPDLLAGTLSQLTEAHGDAPRFSSEHLRLRHPRATMRTFLEEIHNLDAGGSEHIRRTMDVANYAQGLQHEEIDLLAHYLKQVLDRIGFVIYQEIPNDPTQREPYVHFRHEAGNVIISPFETEGGDIEWRFAADTLRSLRSLYTAIEDMPIVKGVTAVPHDSPYFAVRDTLRDRAPSLLHPLGPLEGWQWLALVLLLGTSVFLSFLVSALILWLLRWRSGWAGALANARIRLALVWPLRITFIGFFWYFKIGALGLPESISTPTRSLAATFAIGSAVWLSYRGTGLISDFSSRTIGKEGQQAIFTSLSLGMLRIAIIVVGALLIADSWSLPYSSVLAGLGVGGLALALAAKETVQNTIAGFTLFADSPLKVGDFCRYGDKLGTVEKIGLRSTRIRSRDRTVVSIPNGEFASMQLENFTVRDRVLLRTTLGLRYETTPDQLRFVLAELRRLLLRHPMVDPDPARVRFTGFGAHSLDVEVYAYILTPEWNDFLAIQEDLYLRMMKIVDDSGTGFAFPSQVNYLARDPGNDPARTSEAEAAVAAWRDSNRLPFPHFGPEELEEFAHQLDFPPEGSSVAVESESKPPDAVP